MQEQDRRFCKYFQIRFFDRFSFSLCDAEIAVCCKALLNSFETIHPVYSDLVTVCTEAVMKLDSVTHRVNARLWYFHFELKHTVFLNDMEAAEILFCQTAVLHFNLNNFTENMLPQPDTKKKHTKKILVIMPETHFCHSLPLSVFFCLACDCSATTPGQTSIHKGVHAFSAGYVILPSCQGRERLSHHGTVPSGALLFAGRLRDWG